MLNIVAFTFNPFQENTYLIVNEARQCWIVDPGMYDKRETTELISYITAQELTPQAIINTHAHIDHILGVEAMTGKYNIEFGLHRQDLPMLQLAESSAAMFGINFTGAPAPSFYIQEGTPLQLGTDTVEVFLTPGHSPGSLSFYYRPGNWVISGDVLFSGSIGRTDLPGGDFDTLITAIRTHLFTLPPATTVYSGHGPATTIGEEQQHNPFLQ